jgi:GT2 family glycosyltransferase
LKTITVVVPVHNSGDLLLRCLESLKNSETGFTECIVVDDGSSDGSAEIARAAGATIVETQRQAGPAAARNLGAASASSELLFFVDADVCVHPDTLGRMVDRFENDPSVDAVIGSYDDDPAAQDLVSQYKNLLHHYVHQHGNEESATFWSGCGAIRREVFLSVGGFDESYTRPCIEDIELGYRLRRDGRRIVLDRQIQAKHLKSYRLAGLLRSDIFDRALPWTRLILRSRQLPDHLNVAISQRISALLLLVTLSILIVSAFSPISPAPALLSLAAAICLNRKFYGFLASRRGWRLVAVGLPLHLTYFLYSALCFAAGAALHAWDQALGRDPLAATPD